MHKNAFISEIMGNTIKMNGSKVVLVEKFGDFGGDSALKQGTN